MNKMTFEEIKEHCKKFESRHWEIDIVRYYTCEGEATVIRFFDPKRPNAVSVSGLIGNDIYSSEHVKENIGIIYACFKQMWNMFYIYLESKYLPEMDR